MASTQKLPVGDVLAAIDLGSKEVWDELSDEEKKDVNFWLLNRYVSSLANNARSPYQTYTVDDVEYTIVKTNEYYNKNWNVLGTRHPKLQWQLLCMCGNTGKIEYHKWIGFKQKKGNNNAQKLLEKIYPNMKQDEVELLARLSTKKELKELAKEHDIDVKL
jgi:hypothetical protein